MRRQTVDAGEADEVYRDRALAHEHERCRSWQRQAGKRSSHLTVEHRLRFGLACRDAEPDGANCAR